MSNMQLVGLPNIFTCALSDNHGNFITPLSLSRAVPPSLYPTELQRTTQHPAYVYIFPFPPVYDLVIQHLGQFDEDALLADVLPALARAKGLAIRGVKHGEKAVDEEQRGLIVWGDPWNSTSWEMTPYFLRKWGWLFQGCIDDVLHTTNYWRGLRGEKGLRKEAVACTMSVNC